MMPAEYSVEQRFKRTNCTVKIAGVALFGPHGSKVMDDYYEQVAHPAMAQHSLPVIWTPKASSVNAGLMGK